MTENIKAGQIMARITEFIKRPPDNGVSNFVLSESFKDIPTTPEMIVAIFSHTGDDSSLVTLRIDSRINQLQEYGWIQKLELPQRIRSLDIPDSPELQAPFLALSSINGWPVVALQIAKYINTDEKLAILHTIPGYSPATALGKIKTHINKRLSDFQ